MSTTKLENPADLDTWWCVYFVCSGYGCASIGSPIIKQDAKCLCLKGSSFCDLGNIMGDEGLCMTNSKLLCISQAMQLIPTKPFIECCGKRVFGPAKPGGGGFPAISMPTATTSGSSFGNSNETLEDCTRDLAEAVANEDYLLAHEIQKRRNALLAASEGAVPSALQMA